MLIEVRANALPVQPRSMPEHLGHRYRVDEAIATKRAQLPHRPAIASNHKGLAAVERAHDATTVIAELPLADLLTHGSTVARCATVERSCVHTVDTCDSGLRTKPM